MTITNLFERATKAGYLVDRREIYRAVKAGELLAEKIGNKYQIDNEAAKAYLNKLRIRKRNLNLCVGMAAAVARLFFLPTLKKVFEIAKSDEILNSEFLEEKKT